MNKKQARLRRAKRSRIAMRERGDVRLVVNKTNQHIYAQIVSADSSKTLAFCSTQQKDVKSEIKNSNNIEAATVVGKAIALKAISGGVKKVSFDRSGNKYHGRIKALADAARENGLEF